MKVLLIIIIFFITFSLPGVFGQDRIDVIYKKNGDVLKGLIIETVPNDYVRIELKDGSIFTVKYSEIQKMTKEKSLNMIESKKDGGLGLMFTLLGGGAIYGDFYPGTGLRFGGTPIPAIYVGATVVTHFGEDVSVSYFGAELGYNLSISVLTLQFYSSLGTITGGGLSGFYLGPGIAIYIPIIKSFRIGGDFKYVYVPDIEDGAGGVYLGFQFIW